jgi:hypothetical protein
LPGFGRPKLQLSAPILGDAGLLFVNVREI